jgi:hypothetical protein
MSYLDSIPKNPNPLNLVQANFVIKRMPYIAFFTQGVNIPGINMRNPEQETPLVNIPQQGDTLYYNELRVKFLVDEYMENWLELHTWMVALGFPESTDQHIEIASKPEWTGFGIHSDGTLIILDSKSVPKVEFEFADMLPVSLSDIELDTTGTGAEYATATAVFVYRSFRPRSMKYIT